MRPLKRNSLLYAAPALLLFLLLFVHVTALRSIALVLTVAAAIYVWRKDPGPRIPLKVPLALWLGMALLSLSWARDPAYSLGELRVEIVYDIVYFLSFFALTRERWHWNVFRGALLAGLATMTVMAICLYSRTHDLNADSYLGGVLSICTHLVTLFPFLLAAIFEFRRHTHALVMGFLATVAALAIGYFTFNRNFILAIDGCVIMMALMLIRRHITDGRKLAMLAVATAVALGASGAFLVSVAEERAENGNVDMTVRETVEHDPRWALWSFSLNLVREHPFTGVGFGRFAGYHLFKQQFPGENLYSHAHNPFLNYAVQMGVAGAVVLLFLLFRVFGEFWGLWRSNDPRVNLIGVMGVAMLVGVLIKTQTDDLWIRQHGHLFWALTGMMLGYAHQLRPKPRSDGTAPDRDAFGS